MYAKDRRNIVTIFSFLLQWNHKKYTWNQNVWHGTKLITILIMSYVIWNQIFFHIFEALSQHSCIKINKTTKKVPEAGFEPATFRLWVERSSQAELPRQAQHAFLFYYFQIDYIFYGELSMYYNLKNNRIRFGNVNTIAIYFKTLLI